MKIFSMLILFSSILVIGNNKRNLVAGVLLGTIWIVSTWNYLVFNVPEHLLLQMLAGVLFLLLLIFIILGDILRGDGITTDKIYGGICSYFLFGYIWANLFGIVEILHPGSIQFSNASAGRAVKMSDILYYSYVTLTTLGYGDITPVSLFARSLAILNCLIPSDFVPWQHFSHNSYPFSVLFSAT